MNILRTVALGAAAGALGGIVQPLLGKLEEKLVFPPDEDANVPKHLVRALEDDVGVHPPHAVTLAAGTAFHIGYAFFWGVAYAAARERWPLRPVPAGLGLGALLYVLAFSRAGVGVLAGAEAPPDRRAPRHWLLQTTAPLSYGLTTALTYERLRAV